jgi:hypothetical protein
MTGMFTSAVSILITSSEGLCAVAGAAQKTYSNKVISKTGTVRFILVYVVSNFRRFALRESRQSLRNAVFLIMLDASGKYHQEINI